MDGLSHFTPSQVLTSCLVVKVVNSQVSHHPFRGCERVKADVNDYTNFDRSILHAHQ